ncbi:MAG TPA: hypothetical protein VHB73_04645, partial [Alphaproteobacteria bacterium]|nr:hypothetical protein [Alphaproteobacteria bacterium]
MSAPAPKPNAKMPNVLEIVCASAREVGELYGYEALKNPAPETRLYGEGGALDSIGLVNLV